jgi:RND family efflux transporter MFP subunit
MAFQYRPTLKAVVILASACLLVADELRGQGPPAMPVAVAPVIRRNVQVEQAFVGSVMSARESEIGSAVDGRVVEYPVQQGDYVQKDQKLCQLLTGLLEIEKRLAEAERDLRQQELLEMQNGMRPEEIERARAQLASRKALADYAKNRLIRLQKLTQQGTITEDEIQDAVSRAQQTDQLYQEAKADHDMAVKGHRQEKIEQAKARLMMAQEAVNRIDDQLIKHTIKAPFNGYVVHEHTQVGAWVAKAGLVARVVELEEVDVECQMLEDYIPYLTEGMEVPVEIPALPKQNFVGRIHRIVPQADLRSRNFPVKVRIKNTIDANHVPLIKAGMFARVGLPVGGRTQDALLVPKDAIVTGGPAGPVVWIVEGSDKAGKVRAVPVQSGSAYGSWIVAKGAISENQLVVIEGNERLRPDQSVQVVRKAPPPADSNG